MPDGQRYDPETWAKFESVLKDMEPTQGDAVRRMLQSVERSTYAQQQNFAVLLILETLTRIECDHEVRRDIIKNAIALVATTAKQAAMEHIAQQARDSGLPLHVVTQMYYEEATKAQAQVRARVARMGQLVIEQEMQKHGKRPHD